MATPVVQHVRQLVAHLLRAGDVDAVITVSEHLSTPAQLVVECTSRQDLEALDPARDIHRAVALDEQMNVVALDGEVRNAERGARSELYQRAPERLPEVTASKASHVGNDPHGDVRRMPCLVLRAALVQRVVHQTARASRTGSFTTPAHGCLARDEL